MLCSIHAGKRQHISLSGGRSGSYFEYQAIEHLSARFCATIQIAFTIENHSTGERAIYAASKSMENRRFPFGSGGGKLEDYATANICENLAALETCSTRESGTVEVASGVHYQCGIRISTIKTEPGEAVKDARLPYSRTLRHLENHAESICSAGCRCTVEISSRIHQ
jgi:hypothetical protein